METINTAASASTGPKGSGLLYPLMLIAAIAVIVFSVVGIATVMGWMPRGLSGASPAEKAAVAPPAKAGGSLPVPRTGAGPACRDCGVIKSVHAVEATSEGGGIGAIGAGHEIEKTVKKSVIYEIRVRMNDGSTRTLHEATPPAFAIGDKVRITDRGVAR